MSPHKLFAVCSVYWHTVPYPSFGHTNSLLCAVFTCTPYRILHVATQTVSCVQCLPAHRTVSFMWPHKQFAVCIVYRHTVPYPSCGHTNSSLCAVWAGTPYRILHVATQTVRCVQCLPAHRTVSFMWPHKEFAVCSLCRHTVPYPSCVHTNRYQEAGGLVTTRARLVDHDDQSSN